MRNVVSSIAKPNGVMSCVVMKFGEKLTKLIEERTKGQTDLEGKTGIRQSDLSKLTKRADWKSLTKAFKIARGLGVTLDYLADDELDEIPPPEYTNDEVFVILAMRKAGLTPDDAMKRLMITPLSLEERERTRIEHGQHGGIPMNVKPNQSGAS